MIDFVEISIRKILQNANRILYLIFLVVLVHKILHRNCRHLWKSLVLVLCFELFQTYIWPLGLYLLDSTLPSHKHWILTVLFLILCVIIRWIFHFEENPLPFPAEQFEAPPAPRSPQHVPDLQPNRLTPPQRNQPRGRHTIGHILTTGILQWTTNLTGQQPTVAQQASQQPTLQHREALPPCQDDPPCRHQQGLLTRCQHLQGHRIHEGAWTNQQGHRVNKGAWTNQQGHCVNNGPSTNQQGDSVNNGPSTNLQGDCVNNGLSTNQQVHRMNEGASTSAEATRLENEYRRNLLEGGSSTMTMRTRSGRKYNA